MKRIYKLWRIILLLIILLIPCKEFVKKNGGTIQVESEVGKGTTVRLTLPKTPEFDS